MSKNTGIPYETFTQQIFNHIINQNSVNTINVQQNVILQGVKTTHQIDVFWEFEIGEIIYSTVVQTKDWNQTVDQGELIKFKGVLDDLPNQPRGIFVTKTGYQAGAQKFAKKSGINLYELHVASEKDLKNRISIFLIKLICYVPGTTGFKLLPDNKWFKNERARLKIAPDDAFTIQISRMPNEYIFIDGKGNRIIDAQEIIHSFYPSQFQEIAPTLKTYTFGCDAFITTNNSKVPKIKVNAVQATFSVSKIEQEIQIGGEDIVRFILKNIINNSDHLFDKDMNIIK